MIVSRELLPHDCTTTSHDHKHVGCSVVHHADDSKRSYRTRRSASGDVPVLPSWPRPLLERPHLHVPRQLPKCHGPCNWGHHHWDNYALTTPTRCNNDDERRRQYVGAGAGLGQGQSAAPSSCDCAVTTRVRACAPRNRVAARGEHARQRAHKVRHYSEGNRARDWAPRALLRMTRPHAALLHEKSCMKTSRACSSNNGK